MKLVSVAEMKAIEAEANAAGLTYENMMQNAGRGLAEAVQSLSVDQAEHDVLGLVGPGHNGGDTLVALTRLAADGWRTRAYAIKREHDDLITRLQKAGGQIIYADEDDEFAGLTLALEGATVLLDGVLGTGIKPPLRGEVAAVLAQVHALMDQMSDRPFVVAVDCPSGVDCDSGEAAPECIPADLTVTMAAVKQGLIKLPAFELMGDLQVIDISLPPDLPALESVRTEVAEEDLIAALLPDRPPDAHKGTFGTALVVAGSVNYTGAASLAGMAAYRAGVGLVSLAVPAILHPILAGQFPEATWILLPDELGVISRDAAIVLTQNLGRATALLMGPGLGLEDTTRDFIAKVLAGPAAARASAGRIGFLQGGGGKSPQATGILPPLVFDADGLKLLAKLAAWEKLLPAPAVLTPHPGEMAVLTGLSVDAIQQDRQSVAAKFAAQWGHVVVLKGAFTVVAAPDGRLIVIPVASAALARAGTGDVLAGIITGLRAQGLQAFEAAVAGAWIHAQAGLYAARNMNSTASVLAGDVLNSISDVLGALDDHAEISE